MITFFRASKKLWCDNGMSQASAVAFSFILALFPFFVFTASVATFWGGPESVRETLHQFFVIFPEDVAKALVPQIDKALSANSIDLLTIGGLSMMIFAASGIEGLRTALNRAYGVEETRSFIRRYLQSFFFVIQSSVTIIALGTLFAFAPQIAPKIAPYLAFLTTNLSTVEIITYVVALIMLIIQLCLCHAWLPVGCRSLSQIFPGIIISLILWMIFVGLFSTYVRFSGYMTLYAGLAQFVIILVFFQISALMIILGAEYNRARMTAIEHRLQKRLETKKA